MAVRDTIFGPIGKPKKPKRPTFLRRLGATALSAVGTAAGVKLGNPALGQALGSAAGEGLFKAPPLPGVGEGLGGYAGSLGRGSPKTSPVPVPARRSTSAPGRTPYPPRYSMEGRLLYRRPGSSVAPSRWRYEPSLPGDEMIPFVKKPVRFGLRDLFGREESPFFEPLRDIFR